MAELTHSKRTDVIKNALTVYHWFLRQALTGGRVLARKATGEEVALETAELAAQLDDPELRIFDCTVHLIPNPDIGYTVKPGREDFEKGHIPGAQFIDLQGDLSAPHPKLRFMLPSAADFAAVMGRFGVGDRARE